MRISEAKKLIPKEVVDMYGIGFHRQFLDIHTPVYIGLSSWKNLVIENNEIVTRIRNDNCYITLWKGFKDVHVTIY